MSMSKPSSLNRRAFLGSAAALGAVNHDAARAELGGVLATICPADKKIIHGMTDAIFAPCTA